MKDAVKEVQAIVAVFEESVAAVLPCIGELGASTASSAVLSTASEAVFTIVWPTLRILYEAMCAEPDAVYRSQLREMCELLPQHLGLRRELWFRPTKIGACARGAMWTSPPQTNEWLHAAAPPADDDASLECALATRARVRACCRLQHAWRGRACGLHGCGPYRRTVGALREMTDCSTPVGKVECVLRALNLLALDLAAVMPAAEEITADELLPLFVFVLIRARVTKLYSQARFIADFLPRHYALGRHGYSLATLQAALQYLMEMSWASVSTACTLPFRHISDIPISCSPCLAPHVQRPTSSMCCAGAHGHCTGQAGAPRGDPPLTPP